MRSDVQDARSSSEKKVSLEGSSEPRSSYAKRILALDPKVKLIKEFHDAARGRWFVVVEKEGSRGARSPKNSRGKYRVEWSFVHPQPKRKETRPMASAAIKRFPRLRFPRLRKGLRRFPRLKRKMKK